MLKRYGTWPPKELENSSSAAGPVLIRPGQPSAWVLPFPAGVIHFFTEENKMHQDIKEILFTEEQIAARVRELGAQITKDYAGKTILDRKSVV